jgi:hypothetical protein
VFPPLCVYLFDGDARIDFGKLVVEGGLALIGWAISLMIYLTVSHH